MLVLNERSLIKVFYWPLSKYETPSVKKIIEPTNAGREIYIKKDTPHLLTHSIRPTGRRRDAPSLSRLVGFQIGKVPAESWRDNVGA